MCTHTFVFEGVHNTDSPVYDNTKSRQERVLVLWIGSSMHNASVMPIWRCFWIQNIVIQNCEHGRWEFGGEGGSLEGAQELFICTTFNAWHGGHTH